MEAQESILRELLLFRNALLLGAVLMAVYDVFRIFRRILPHGTFLVSLEDMLYWIGTGVAVFLLLYNQNDGRIRVYVFGGLAVGALLYNRLFGRFLIRAVSKVVAGIKKRLKKFWKKVTMKTDEPKT